MLTDIPEHLDFIDNIHDYSLELFANPKMKTTIEGTKPILKAIGEVLSGIEIWEKDVIQQQISDLIKSLELKNGQLLWPLRIALSGKSFTPGGGVEICIMLGKEESVNRINQAIEKIERSQ